MKGMNLKNQISKYWNVLLLSVFLVAACATPQHGGPNASHGATSMMEGFAHLILSPFQIAAGLLEGVASLPYYASTGLHEINKGLINAQAKVSLDDTYEAAYGKRLDQVPSDGNTGEVFRRMKHATDYFRKVLKQYGIQDPQNYILTSIDTANRDGYTLFAVVYRPAKAITVLDKYDGKTIRNFTSEDRLFYEPFAVDVNGAPLDTIIDWAGIPKEYSDSQKQQAILLTLAANAVASEKRRMDYWPAEKRWVTGEFLDIVKSQNQKVQKSLGI